MDIYLLRDGKEFGPYSEEMTQSFLEQGSVVWDDLAWTPGLPAWSPLGRVLSPAERPAEEPAVEFQEEQPAEPQPVAALEDEPPQEVELVPEAHHTSEPPTTKQKAFLTYMGLHFSRETTKETAALLVSEALEEPRLNARVLQWNEDRLRLHPEIFSAELQAKKEDRPNRFCEACRHEGADIFTEVTAAHCQVLVTYLDVNFPNWDANEADAARAYFFPAIADRFPLLVRKGWREKLHYPSGPKIVAGFGKRGTTRLLHRGPSPVGALIRGAVFGLALLLVFYVGVQFFSAESPEETTAPVGEKVAPATPAPAPKMAGASEPARLVEPAKRTETEPEKGDTEMVASVTTAAAPSADPPTMEATPAAPAEPKTRVTVTKPTEVKLRYGSTKILSGTEFKIVTRDASSVTVIHLAETVTIPIQNTDLALPAQ